LYSDIANAEFQYSISSVFCKPFILRDGKDSKVRLNIIILTFFCLILSSTSVGITNSLAVQSQEHIVEISALRFRPASLTVHSGDVVKWVNRDNRRHQLMSISEGGWRSRTLKPGESFVQFIGKTTFYICTLHPNMQGKILVEGR
jgi:plastocyanin